MAAALLASCSIDDRQPRLPRDAGGSLPVQTADGDPLPVQTADAAFSPGVVGRELPPANCEGCTIGERCVSRGARNSANACQICDPSRSALSFSVNANAPCGSGPSECSAEDTCNAQGQCVLNHEADGTPCGADGSDLVCLSGECTGCATAPAPDASCAAQSSSKPVCDLARNVCVACLPASCSGATPMCDPELGCRACTEHADCPSSACHLSGLNRGVCFAESEVVLVSDAAALRTQLENVVPNTPRVLRLAATTFAFAERLDFGSAGTELAMLGTPGTVLTGGPANDGLPLVNVGFAAVVYLAGLTIADGPSRAIETASGSILWLDDVQIRGYAGITAVFGRAEGHIRRSRISAPNVAVHWQGGELFMENSSLGPFAAIGLQTSGAPILDVRYVSIVGNVTSLSCAANLGPSGLVRNSLFTGTTSSAVVGAACDSLTFTGNAVDQAGFGSSVAHYDATWFFGAPSGDFRLTAIGAAAIGDAAQWAPGDPPLDIDGAARPTSAPGKPGIDQP